MIRWNNGWHGGRRTLFLVDHCRAATRLRADNVAAGLRRLGWGAAVVPPHLTLRQRRRVLAAHAPDVVIMGKSRHPLNRPEHLAGIPFVYDIDDADFEDPRLTDVIAETCARAAGVIAGSRHVADWCARHNPNTTVVWTAGDLSPGPRPPQAERAPLVAWAQRAPLDYAAELRFVARVAGALCQRRGSVRLRLYGRRPGDDIARLRRLFDPRVRLEWLPTLGYGAFVRSLREVAVGLMPLDPDEPYSRGKSFGKVLGYIDARVPVVASDLADHAAFFTGASAVVSNDPATWVGAIDRLLDDAAIRETMADRAMARFETCLSVEVAAARVDAFLGRTLDAGSRGPAQERSGRPPSTASNSMIRSTASPTRSPERA